MKIKKFKAKNMHDALRLVRQELGPDAAVLSTRELTPSGPWRWFSRSFQIEVTASDQVSVPSRLRKARRRSAVRPAEQPAAATVPRTANPRENSSAETSSLPSVAAPPATESLTQLRDQLLQLQAHIHGLRDAPRTTVTHAPDTMLKVQADLLKADVPSELARELTETVGSTISIDQLQDPQAVSQALRQSIEDSIQVTGEIQAAADQPRFVALVGPTGVGKTTTIAKLAANYRLRQQRKVALITVDTYRIAAIDQLQTYADIMEIPLEVVGTSREMRAAIERLRDRELILMDTAGRSPHDEIKLQELKSILAEAHADEVHLVLSATDGANHLIRAAAQFAEVGITALALTKLDEAKSHGHLLALLRQSQLPLSYVTSGQNVPDDIEPANPQKLAQLLFPS